MGRKFELVEKDSKSPLPLILMEIKTVVAAFVAGDLNHVHVDWL
jgi:hypothetical protein